MNSFPKLSYACPIPWADLKGDERAKFCGKCGRTIVNFSELDEKARLALLAKADTERMCVTYYRRLSGEFVTPDSPLTSEERSGIKQLGIATLSAGALALAAGCMATDQSAKTHATPAPSAPTQPAAEKSGSWSEAQKLARYDKNKNGKLDPDESATMQADLARGAKPLSDNDVMVLQAFGVVAETTPAQMKQGLAHKIRLEREDKESTDPATGPYSAEDWQNYWAETIRGFRNPRQIGGVGPHADEYVRYIISQRRKFHLPELKAANAP